MPKKHKPRSGSMQFWPRKRAKRSYARVRAWNAQEAKPAGFAGYKAGMTHVVAIDSRKNARLKGEEVPHPVTIIECPPLRIAGARLYKHGKAASEILVSNDKALSKKLKTGKADLKSLDKVKPEEYDDIAILVYTQPGSTGIGKKKPELFEVKLGGDNADKLAYIKQKAGQDIKVNEIFEEGELVDVHSITKGRGTPGPVRRFGIGLKSHKAEKGRRRPGTLGGWKAQQHFMYRVPMAGQSGYQQRTEHNLQIMKVGEDPKEINAKGGFVRYGQVKNDYVLLKGSVPGPKKRLIIFTKATRPGARHDLPTIQYISRSSQQGR